MNVKSKLKTISILIASLSLPSVSIADTVFIEDNQLVSVKTVKEGKYNNVSFTFNEKVSISNDKENLSNVNNDIVLYTEVSPSHLVSASTKSATATPTQPSLNTENSKNVPSLSSLLKTNDGNENFSNSNIHRLKNTVSNLKEFNKTNNDNSINNIRVVGLNNISNEKIINIANLRNIKVIESDSDLALIEHKIAESGYFQSVNVRFEPIYGYLELNVVENPIISEFHIDGANLISKKTIEDSLRRYELGKGNVFNPILLKEYILSLRNEYVSQGKEQVQINLTPLMEQNNIKLTLKINEGDTVKINKIDFVDNTRFSSNELKDILTSNEKNFLSSIISNNKLNQEKLNYDLEKIVDLYQNNGYLQSHIKHVDFVDLISDKGKPEKNIIIHVHEGNVFHYSKPEFNFSEGVKNTGLIQKLENDEKFLVLKEGNLYKRDEVVSLNKNIEEYLANLGYAFSKIDVEAATSVDNKVTFIFNISSGNKFNINNIRVTGNEKTNTDVILREIRQKSGETFDLSKMQRSKERLDLTGYFNNVDMNTKISGDNLVDIEINVEERRTGTIQANLGYMQDFGVTLGFGAEDRNFRGTGKALGSSINYNKVQKNIDLNYSYPFFFKNGTSLGFNLYGNIYDPRKQDGNNQYYKTSKYGMGLNFGIPLNEYDRIYVGGILENMSLNTYENAPLKYRDFIFDNGKLNGNGLGKYNGTVGKLTVGWGRNKTNHAYWPTTGYLTNINGEVTLPGSKLNYYKFNASNKFFIPIGKESTVILNGNIGYANSFGKTNELPFFENYYAGGLNSVRGFEGGSLGPKVYDVNNNVITYGGNKFVNLGAEFQTPIPFIKDSSNVRMSVFIDAASTWDNKTYTNKDSDNSVSVYGRNHKSTFSNELRYSAGIAYTWLSPIGPVKFSYAIPLNKKDNDQIQKFQFQLGTTF